MGSVYQRVFSLCREAAREELRRTYGEQLEKWVHRANASVTDVAAALGWKRANLYKVFRGRLPLHAEDLYLLPPEVLRIVLADLAATIEELEAALAPLRTRLRQVVAEGAKVLEMRSRGGEG